ncbi:beta-lactamase [Catenulispora acidiphila DSM 44928]|uniref:Beta-lactamase n=1 Tax=Catenulispora acidiphila (strain DSM 44928 / JCM 14897 / NBRC 102108 / NRRL B-24433 / ID139908) TaxID=479433 RepID=C7Q7A3_CATAD|nr:EstA family serine hydrolase [Catenulispora acidiphila]ACU70191.1 beta-lactamase [Catenulispora acidiphila DSM 44928]
MTEDALHRIATLVADRPGQAQLHVLRHGTPVLDLNVRCAPDTPFLLWSTGKPLTAMAVHQLAERGLLDLDAPIAEHWPEYGRAGKESATPRHALTHSTGAPLSTWHVVGDAWIMHDWDRSVRAAAAAPAKREPGWSSAYHILSQGFILGELLQRVTGTQLAEYLSTEILAPAGLHHTTLGLPTSQWDARAVLELSKTPRTQLPDRLKVARFAKKTVRTAPIPAATVHSTARDMARFFQLLLDGGSIDGVTVFKPETVQSARNPALYGAPGVRPDPIIGHTVRWAHGFQLGWGARSVQTAQPFGVTAGEEVFGHNGSNYCNAWADPEHGLVFAYLTNYMTPRGPALAWQTELSDLVRAAVASEMQ